MIMATVLRGNLRVAVLVNEIGDLDVDSLLVDTGKASCCIRITFNHIRELN